MTLGNKTYWVIEYKVKGDVDLRKLSSTFDDYSIAVITANNMHKIKHNVEWAYIRKVTEIIESTVGNYHWEDGKPIWDGHKDAYVK